MRYGQVDLRKSKTYATFVVKKQMIMVSKTLLAYDG